MSWKEFIPTITFLSKFLGIYLAGNLLYGVFVEHYEPRADPATREVAKESASLLMACGWETSIADDQAKPHTIIRNRNRNVLLVYEGCNGLNAAIIFVAFLVAFGPLKSKLLWFILIGLLIIHVVNLGRVTLLFWVAEEQPQYMYFMHKYFFTTILYVAIFLLWVVWIKKFSLFRD
jgi:exosortase family protein XrtF